MLFMLFMAACFVLILERTFRIAVFLWFVFILERTFRIAVFLASGSVRFALLCFWFSRSSWSVRFTLLCFCACVAIFERTSRIAVFSFVSGGAGRSPLNNCVLMSVGL